MAIRLDRRLAVGMAVASAKCTIIAIVFIYICNNNYCLHSSLDCIRFALSVLPFCAYPLMPSSLRGILHFRRLSVTIDYRQVGPLATHSPLLLFDVVISARPRGELATTVPSCSHVLIACSLSACSMQVSRVACVRAIDLIRINIGILHIASAYSAPFVL